MKFYLCSVCGNLVEVVEDGGNTPSCCGRTMRLLSPGETDGAVEKHLPVMKECMVEDTHGKHCKIVVQVGKVPHPMEDGHFIKWIALETEHGFQIAYLKSGDEACVTFYEDEKVVAIYAYCNLHGLWKTEIL